MTDEGAKDTEGFVESTGMKYGYAYDKGGKLMSWSGAGGYPHALLVDPTGKVVWDGHPSSLSEDVIQKALKGSLTKPAWDWPASAKDVRTALTKKNYADAIAKADKVPSTDGGAEIKTALLGLVKSRVQSLQATYDAGDFLGATETAAALSKQLDGLPEKAEVDKVMGALKANKDADRVIKAQKKLAELRAKRIKKRELEATIEDLKKMEKEFAGSYVANQAEAFRKELQQRMKEDG